MRKMIVVLVLAVMSTAASCNKNLPPNAAVEDQVAVRATQFIEAVRVVNAKLPGLECPADVKPSADAPCLGKEEAADIYKMLAKIGAGGKDLSAALTIVDEAKTAAERKSGLEAAAGVLKSLSSSIDRVQIRPLNAEVRSTLVALFATASNILLTITLF